MTTARDFFDRVRSASIDAEKCRTQLIELECRALSIGSQGFEPRTKSTPDPQRMAGRVNAYIDREMALRERQEADYALIDSACVVLYGKDNDGGLSETKGPAFADVLWWRYCAAETWEHISTALGYSERQCMRIHDIALSWMDEVRFESAIIDTA